MNFGEPNSTITNNVVDGEKVMRPFVYLSIIFILGIVSVQAEVGRLLPSTSSSQELTTTRPFEKHPQELAAALNKKSNSRYKPTTELNYYWDTVGWVRARLIKFSYNTKGQMLSMAVMDSAGVDTFESNTFRYNGNLPVGRTTNYYDTIGVSRSITDTLIYDTYNNIERYSLSEWDTASKQWILSYGEKTSYVYNGLGHFTVMTVKQYDTSGMDYNYYRESYIRNTDGSYSQMTYDEWDTTSTWRPIKREDSVQWHSWNPIDLPVHYRGEGGSLYSQKFIQQSKGAIWADSFKFSRVYDTLLGNVGLASLSDGKGGWTLAEKNETKLDTTGYVSETIDYYYQSNKWIESYKIKYVSRFNPNGERVDVKSILYNYNTKKYDSLGWSVFGNFFIYTGLDKINRSDISLKIYPNPAMDFIKVQSNEPIRRLSVFTAKGEIVYLPFIGNEINTQSLSAGMYIIRAETRNGITHSKNFVKQ